MTRALRVGLIGLGVAGQRHAAACRRVPELELVAAADPAPAAAQAAAELGLRCYPTYRELLEAVSLDAAVISLPHALLAEAAIVCLSRGLHVLLEKPMAVTLREADAVLAAARASGGRLMVNFVHRFRAEYRQARAMIAAGAIGQPVVVLDAMTSGRSQMPAWVWDRASSGGGMMMYNGVHSVDRLAWLAGSAIARASAVAGTFSYPVEVEDTLAGVVVFHSGALGVVLQHKSDAPVTLAGWDTAVWGTRGAVRIAGGVLELASDAARARLTVEQDDRFLGAAREFAAAVLKGRDPSPGGEDGRRALAGVLALYESVATGRTVELGNSRGEVLHA
ncbi:MAG: Gfo/Idh/MocA family oxidoreductase [Armatimonadota bacterium]|nr:Gfo/Idh/MocA family oxidoreductase [Armatimonadota bacterium]